MNGLAKAIKEAGTASHLAALLGIKPMSVSRWKTRYKGVVPADRVLQIYQATGVTPHELRPDLYPNPTDGLPQDHDGSTTAA
jgi:DNA-binding transcriptional regulator YdaS (Cro superfamily)